MRSTIETLELDQSLRKSRSIYVTLAIVFFPIAVTGLGHSFSAIGAISKSLSDDVFPNGLGGAIGFLAVGVIFIGLEYSVISQVVEANRRLKTLRDHPDQPVRRLPTPFQSSLFGPYH